MEQISISPMRVAKVTLLGFAAGVCSAVLLTLLFSALLALGVPDGAIPLFTYLTVFFAAGCGGLCAGMKGKTRGLLFGLCAGIAFFLLHFLSSALFGEITASLLTYLATEVVGGIFGGILGVNLRRS
ncbi:MAG: TIGR04086 family membrane protein [Clostridia bacterium]|nr:TIGR04086 family membrane protein [Clostridia bacterium]